MRVFWNVLKRLLALIGITFVMFNLVAYFVLNSRAVQGQIIAQLNQDYLAEYGLQIQLKSLSLGSFPLTINLNGVGVVRGEGNTSQNAEPGSEDAGNLIVGADRVSLGLDLVTTYLSRKLVIDYFKIAGVELSLQYDPSGRILHPFSSLNLPLPTDSGEAVNPQQLVGRLRELLPRETKLVNARIRFTPVSATADNVNVSDKPLIHHIVTMDLINVVNASPTDRSVPISVWVELGESSLRAESLDDSLVFKHLKAKLDVTEKNVQLHSLQAGGPWGQVSGIGGVQLGTAASTTNYDIALSGDFDFAEQMRLVGLKGSGKMQLQGKVFSKRGLVEGPIFSGNGKWQDLNLEGFAIYSGTSDLMLEDNAVTHTDTVITTPKNAKLRVHGSFALYDDFKYQVQGSVENLTFGELMQGLDAPTDVIDFVMNARTLEASGTIVPDEARGFDLRVEGSVAARSLSIPQLPLSKRFPAPECQVELKLYSDVNHLVLNQSTASCGKKRDDSIRVGKGTVLYSNGETYFALDGKGVDLSLISPFINEPVEGRGAVRGELTGSAKTPLVFAAQVEARDALLYGVRAQSVRGRLSIDAEKIVGSHVSATLGGHLPSEVKCSGFLLDFDRLNLKVEATATGDLTSLFPAIRSYLPQDFPAVGGKFTIEKFALAGPLATPERWNVEAQAEAVHVTAFGKELGRIRAHFTCQNGKCEESFLMAEDARIQRAGAGKEFTAAQVPGNGNPLTSQRTVALLEVKRLSFDDVDLRLEVQNLDVGVLTPLGVSDFSGEIDARLFLRGPWKQWQGSLQASVDKVKVRQVSLGPLEMNAHGDSVSGLNAVFYGQYRQLAARLKLPHDLKGKGSLYIHAQDFDFSVFFPEESRGKHNFLSSANAEFLLEGPGPLAEFPAEELLWHERWTGAGRLAGFEVHGHQVSLTLTKPVEVSLRGGKVELKTLELTSGNSSVRVFGNYALEQNHLEAEVDAQIDLGVLHDFFSWIHGAEGEVVAKIKVTGTLPKVALAGTARLKGRSLGIKELAPPFTNMSGRFLFENDRLEIQSFRADKGTGTVEVVGSINWSKMLTREHSQPTLGLQVTAEKAQFRFPTPVLNAIKTTLDGKVEVYGTGIPYHVDGEVTVERALGFRDVTCQDMISELTDKSVREETLVVRPWVLLDLDVVADKSIVLQTTCFRGRLSGAVHVTGTDASPALIGQIRVDKGTVRYQRRSYDIKTGELIFNHPVRSMPRLEWKLVSQVAQYSVYMSIEGPLNEARPNYWSDPPSGTNGEPLSQNEIINMFYTGQVPSSGSGGRNPENWLANTAASYLATSLDESLALTQTISRLTAGVVDDVQLQPVIEGGKAKVRARLSRSLGERFNLNLDIDQGAQGSSRQALQGTWYLNEGVNVQGGLERTPSDTGPKQEFSGGLRFQFGSE